LESPQLLLREIVSLVNGSFLTRNPDLDLVIPFAAASDLMSDVLAFAKPHSVLLTGLANSHVVHTAEMVDISAIVFVRGKVPPSDVVSLAEEKGIPLVTSPFTMYELCGCLYQAGLSGCGTQSRT
jgi:hypothetical protein